MRSLVVLAAILLTPVAAPAVHAEIMRNPRAWTVAPPFEKSDDARRAISGAACVRGTPHCLAVNDETKYAQFFDIDGRTLRPKRVIRLLPDEQDGVDMKEIDAEGAGYAPAADGAPAYYYVIGSHGRSRNGALRPSVFFLLRFPVDRTTGLPTFGFSDEDVAPQVERTALLRDTIKNRKELAAWAEQPLDRCGVTIEGLAVHGEHILLGLRGPSVDGQAFILRVAIDDLFKDEAPAATAKRLALGKGVGVRDLAPVAGGILILAGRSHDGEPATNAPTGCGDPSPLPSPAVWFWSGNDADPPRALGALPGIDTAMKPEALVVLGETASSYRVLVMFDGSEDGGPVEFTIDK